MVEETEYSYYIKIPKDRIAVLIGTKGKIKKEIEKETHSKIRVDSKDGDITIMGEDSIGIFSAREIIKAIGRGFNPDVASLLLKQDYCFEALNIGDYAGKSKKKMLRLRGRVIGEGGKTRRTIETLTETNMSVYGKTVSIIGTHANAALARKAIEGLLAGANHAAVYRSLEKKRKELKMRAFEPAESKEDKHG